MKICLNCGEVADEDDVICPECGYIEVVDSEKLIDMANAYREYVLDPDKDEDRVDN